MKKNKASSGKDRTALAHKNNNSGLKATELVSLTALLFLKLLYFYIYIGIGTHSLTLLLESAVLILAVWFIFVLTKKRMPYGLTFGIYLFVSVVMLIDLTYFNYFGKLPSVFTLSNTGLIGDVGASVLKLLSLSSLVSVIDLPIIAFYLLFVRKKLKDIEIDVFSRFKKIVPILLAAVFALLCGDIVITRFMLPDLRNEFVVFHAVDIGRYVFGVNESETGYHDMIKTDYTNSALHGVADGRNLIVIQVESLQGFAVSRSYNGKEITPNLNKLIKDGVSFENYYYQTGGGNTSDAEFTVNNSLFAPEYESAYIKYADNTYYGLPWILKENGFNTAVAYHAFKGDFWNREKAYVNQGFDDFISREDVDVLKDGETIGLGMNDRDFFIQSLEHIKTLEKPFYSFLITLTSHHPYTMPFENRFDILPEDEDSIFADYISAINYIDECIGVFIEGLKEAGLYEQSVIVVYGDHFAIPLNETDSTEPLGRLLGHEYNFDDFLNVPCIVAVPGLDEATAEKLSETETVTGGHADLMPTILDLFGYKSDNMIMFGQNLFSSDKGIVYPQASLQRGSFIDDDTVFVFPQNRMLINAVAYSKADRTPIDPESCIKNYDAALAAYADSSRILERDLIADIIASGRAAALKSLAEEESAEPEAVSKVKLQTSSFGKWEDEMIRNVNYRALIFKPSDLPGSHNGTEISNGLLTLENGNKYGVFVSEPVFVGNFDMLIVTWKAISADPGVISPDVRISIAYELDDGDYSNFYSTGRWSQRKGVSASASSSDIHGQMEIDTFYPNQQNSTKIIIKAELFSDNPLETFGGLEYIAATGNKDHKMIFESVPEKMLIDVPSRSQMVIPKIGGVICSPTSVAMVLEYLGTNIPTEKVAQGVYDNKVGIYGNWIFNTAYAASLGYNAYVDYYDMYALKYAISCGVPVICSIATSDKSMLEGSPQAYPSGHLVVVCGYENEGGTDYVIVNDPAAPEKSTVRRRYRVDQFKRVWNGVVYIIQ